MHGNRIFRYLCGELGKSMKRYDIIVIGGGAAGLMAAVGASGEGRKVAVLEKMSRPGRKIMITGKGRCNRSAIR